MARPAAERRSQIARSAAAQDETGHCKGKTQRFEERPTGRERTLRRLRRKVADSRRGRVCGAGEGGQRRGREGRTGRGYGIPLALMETFMIARSGNGVGTGYRR